MRTMTANIKTEIAISPADHAATVVGEVIDLMGAGRVAFVLSTGDVTGAGDFSAVLQESDTTVSGDFTDVADDQVDSNAPESLEGSSSYAIGYRGFKRYIRLALIKAGGTSIEAGASAVLSDLTERPVG